MFRKVRNPEVSNAICTSLDPVSLSWERLSSMIFCLSTCSDILIDLITRPDGLTGANPRRRVSRNAVFVSLSGGLIPDRQHGRGNNSEEWLLTMR